MFGSTYNGQFEDVKAFNDKVGEIIYFFSAKNLQSVLPKSLRLSRVGCNRYGTHVLKVTNKHHTISQYCTEELLYCSCTVS